MSEGKLNWSWRIMGGEINQEPQSSFLGSKEEILISLFFGYNVFWIKRRVRSKIEDGDWRKRSRRRRRSIEGVRRFSLAVSFRVRAGRRLEWPWKFNSPLEQRPCPFPLCCAVNLTSFRRRHRRTDSCCIRSTGFANPFSSNVD